MNILELSATEIASKIAAGELTSREVTTFFLERIDTLDEKVVAFTSRNSHALQQAEEADRKIQAGELSGPLAGVPIAIKDVLCTPDMPTTCGSQMLKEFTAPYTATAVQKILDAGMIILGKTNMDEFAMGGSTETSVFGATHNPWDLSRTAGGSSGGSAAALAAGMAPITIGSDTGGSVRQPAAFCGVCGLKPTYGRVSRFGLVAFASSLDQVGCFAHHSSDLAATLQIIAGYDKRDSTSVNAEVADYSASLPDSLSGLKVGIIREHLENEALDPEVRAAVAKSQDCLKGLGAEIIEVELPHTNYSVPAYYVVAPCEASGNLSRYDGVHYGFRQLGASEDPPLEGMILASRSKGFGAEVKRRIMLGTFALSEGYADAYYKKALRVRRLIAQDYQQAFEKVDVLLGPTTPTPPYELGEKVDDPVQMYLGDLFTVGANLAGLPGLSVPAGMNEAGLPLAVQLQGPAMGEAKLLQVAHQLQHAGLYAPQVAKLA